VYSHRYGCAITGGYVYRGASVPALRGSYVYGDYCSGDLWAIPAAGGRAHRLAVPSVPGLSSFGLGTNGELYAVSLSGSVLRFSAGP